MSSPDSGSNRFGYSDASIAGFCMVVAGFVALMGIVTAELLYPDYSTRRAISDLGATTPPNPVVHQPSATIFNGTMLATGALVVVSAYFVHQAIGGRAFPLALAGFGVGAFGVGTFPASAPPWHGLFALLTFFSGGVAAVLSARAVSRPFSLLCGCFGGVALVALLGGVLWLADVPSPLAFFGFGGIERWVVYPLVVWGLAFGGYLLAIPDSSRPSER